MSYVPRTVTALLSGLSAVRLKTGSPVSADSSTLTDTNIDPTKAIDCGGLATIWVAVEMANSGTQTAAGAGSILLEQLWRDASAANGFRWKRPMFGGDPQSPAAEKALLDAGGGWVELRVDGSTVFLRIDTITSTADNILILAKPGQPLPSNRRYS